MLDSSNKKFSTISSTTPLFQPRAPFIDHVWNRIGLLLFKYHTQLITAAVVSFLLRMLTSLIPSVWNGFIYVRAYVSSVLREYGFQVELLTRWSEGSSFLFLSNPIRPYIFVYIFVTVLILTFLVPKLMKHVAGVICIISFSSYYVHYYLCQLDRLYLQMFETEEERQAPYHKRLYSLVAFGYVFFFPTICLLAQFYFIGYSVAFLHAMFSFWWIYFDKDNTIQQNHMQLVDKVLRPIFAPDKKVDEWIREVKDTSKTLFYPSAYGLLELPNLEKDPSITMAIYAYGLFPQDFSIVVYCALLKDDELFNIYQRLKNGYFLRRSTTHSFPATLFAVPDLPPIPPPVPVVDFPPTGIPKNFPEGGMPSGARLPTPSGGSARPFETLMVDAVRGSVRAYEALSPRGKAVVVAGGVVCVGAACYFAHEWMMQPLKVAVITTEGEIEVAKTNANKDIEVAKTNANKDIEVAKSNIEVAKSNMEMEKYRYKQKKLEFQQHQQKMNETKGWWK